MGGSRNCICQERRTADMLTLTCRRVKYGNTVQRIFTSWFGTYCTYCIFFGCYCSSGKFCKKIQYLWLFLENQIKYSWKSINSLLKYCTLNKDPLYTSVLTTIFFLWLLLPGTLVYFSDFLAVKYVKNIKNSFLGVFLVNTHLNICILFLWFNKFHFGGGLYKISFACLSVCLPVCLFVYPSVQHFYQKWLISFFFLTWW